MKIAFDLRRIGNPGVGRYMDCLVTAILREAPQHDYLFIMAPETEHLLRCHAQGQVIHSSVKYYSIAEQIEIPRILRKHGVDLFHALHFVVPLLKTCPTMVTICDAIHFVYPQDLPSFTGRVYAKAMMTAAGHIADRVLTISEYSKLDLVRYLHINPAKIVITYASVDERFQVVSDSASLMQVRRKLGVSGDFILYTGIFKERKNHIGLLKAFAALLASGVSAQLVIAGPLGAGQQLLQERAREIGVADKVVFAGFVSEEELPSLYSAAKLYVCPSLYEGFGQTAVEAMACGTPVVCHRGTSLTEVCGDAALLADARNPEEFASAMRQAIEDTETRKTLIGRGFVNAARFTPSRIAHSTLLAYEEVLSGHVVGKNALI
jgi:glycosyltransferase involved in cell wall biosynthesis